MSALRLSLLLLTAAPTLGWWDPGHMMCAAVAESHVEPGVKQEIDRLLSIIPGNFTRDMISATHWADDLGARKYISEEQWEDLMGGFANNVSEYGEVATFNITEEQYYSRKPWHYINLPFDDGATCPEDLIPEINAIDGLDYHMEVPIV